MFQAALQPVVLFNTGEPVYARISR
ncbi:hypothetical protein ARTHRO9V_90381 [Arthrobacter sp. 9V]|nr:hypothetical protein ARTHRO9V_90381 [Arthrobacter sp. 9V]